MILKIIIIIILVFSVAYIFFKRKQNKQLAYIKDYKFHPTLEQKIKIKYPHLKAEEITLVFDALRDYFRFCNQAKTQMVAMPSQVVDMAWHEFILLTRAYENFSHKAIGRFLHHTPTEAMTTPTLAQNGIKRTWRLACANEQINPSSPSQLPLLFAIDAKLNIDDGFIYSLNCQSSLGSGDSYCAGHIGCASGCGGTSDSGGGSDCGGGGGCGGGD